MRKTTVLAITCSFFDHFGSSWACFSSENGPCCVAVQQPVQLLNLKASNCNCSCSCYQLGLGWVAVFLQLLQLDLTRLVFGQIFIRTVQGISWLAKPAYPITATSFPSPHLEFLLLLLFWGFVWFVWSLLHQHVTVIEGQWLHNKVDNWHKQYPGQKVTGWLTSNMKD